MNQLEDILKSLLQERCEASGSARSNLRAWMTEHLQRVTPSDAETLLTKLLDIFSELTLEENQAWVLSFFSEFFDRLAPSLGADKCLYLVALAQMFITSESPLVLSAVLDLTWALWKGCWQILTGADDAMLTELESLLMSVAANVVSNRALLDSCRCHGVKVLFHAVISLSEEHDVEARYSDNVLRKVQEGFFRIDLAQMTVAVKERAVALAKSAMAVLLSVLDDSLTHVTVIVCVVDSVAQIVQSAVGLWEFIIPALCTTTQKVFSCTNAVVPNSSLKTPSSVLALGRTFSAVLRIPMAANYHSMASAALTLIGCKPSVPLWIEESRSQNPESSEVLIIDGVAANEGSATGEQNSPEKYDTVIEALKKEAQMVSTTMGELPLEEVVSMIIFSIKRIPSNSAPIEEQHLNGLKSMQIAAARKAQAQELERMRQRANKNIDDLMPGEIVDHVDSGYKARVAAQEMLENSERRSMFLRAAFFSLLHSFKLLQSHERAEPKIAVAQGVIARVFAKLPTIVTDSASDALCLLWSDWLRTVDHRDAASCSADPTFGLLIQVLYMKYAQLSPARIAQAQKHNFSFFFEGAPNPLPTTASAPSPEDFIDLDEPTSWLLSRKRAREEELNAETWSFSDDTPQETTEYSHLLCRLIALTIDFCCSEDGSSNKGRGEQLLFQLLLQCPVLLQGVWSYINRTLCLSEKLQVASLGVRALSAIITQRSVYASPALSLLLNYTTCSKKATRLLSVKELRNLLLQTSSPVAALTPSHENAIVEFARRALLRIPVMQMAKVEAQVLQSDPGAENKENAMKAKLQVLVSRQMGLFLVLCSMKKHVQLFRELLLVFQKCSDNAAAQRQSTCSQLQELLLEAPEVTDLVRTIFKSGQMVQEVLKQLRAFPAGSEPLVQHVLRVLALELHKTAATQQAEKGTPATAKEMTKLIAKSLVGHCEAFFEDSVRETDSGALYDARFIVPVMVLVPRRKLKSDYIPSLMQILSSSKEPAKSAAVKDFELGVREIIRPCHIDFGDGEDRGLNPVDFIVYVHVIHQNELQGISHYMATSAISTTLGMKRQIGGKMEPLYSVDDVEKVLQRLVQMRPIPTLTMHTAILICNLYRTEEKYVVNTVLREIARQALWNSDEILWKGAVIFMELHWAEAKDFLLSLPNNVLLQTLNSNERLKRNFMDALPLLPKIYDKIVASLTS